MGRRTFLGLVILASALAPASAHPEQPANRTEGCAERYDPHLDYFPKKARIRYATGFAIEYRSHYKVLTVLTPWPGAEEPFRYVLVQCGTPRPSGFGRAQLIEVPVHTMAALSLTHLPHLELLGEVDSLVALSDRDRVYSARIRERIAKGKVRAVGRGTTLNIETLLELAPDLVTAVGHDQPQYNAHPLLERAGVHVALNSEYLEQSPLGRAEWLKFTAAFFNKEGTAERIFDELAQQYEAYAAKAKPIWVRHRPTVFGGELFRDTWYIPGGKSFVAQLVRDAGGTYLWAEDTHRAAVPLDFEAVFDRAANADYWFTGRLEWFSRAAMLAENERYGSFKALRQGQVYNSNRRINGQGANDYWETGVMEPHLILADLIRILHPDWLPEHRLKYYRQLQ